MLAALALVLAALAAPSNAQPTVAAWPEPQEQETPDPCGILVARAWVDPYFGVDLPYLTTGGGPFAGLPGAPSTQVNDPTAPFRTLQAAIDAVFFQQGLFHTPNVPTHGIVYALPGIYGPSGSGDIFPILMRDRVSVQGLSGRGCVLRELSRTVPALLVSPPVEAFWPQSVGGILPEVVLVDFETASAQGNFLIPLQIPWSNEPESEELFDGFTLEGGDIQMMFWVQPSSATTAKPTRARVTNCIFDMRHNWQPEAGAWVDGPYIGIELAKHFTPLSPSPIKGYPEQNVLIAQNTFVMASRRFNTPAGQDPWIRCRDEAVGIIDVTDSACSLQIAACEAYPRGVGSPGIFNNLFRTAPPTAGATILPMAMLGIDSGDTRMIDGVTGLTTDTNAFAPGRVGATNNYFASTPVIPQFQGSGLGLTLVDCGPSTQCPAPQACNPNLQPSGCQQATIPTPGVAIWDGGTGPNAGVDPCFVGEYLNERGQVPPAVAGIFYNDWRLVPNSPLADRGAMPQAAVPGGTAAMFCAVFGPCWMEPDCSLLRSMDWDAEVYGNPRIVGGRPDIGADETHGYVVAGSYGNDSISHNNPATNLAPTAAQGRSARRLLLDDEALNQLVVINGKTRLQPTSPPNAWTQPPATLTPPTNGGTGLLIDYRTQWIAFGNTGQTPTPWYSGVLPTPWQDTYLPSWMTLSSQTPSTFVNLLQGDNETIQVPLVSAYFATQLVMYVTLNSPVGWSNMQFEYR